MRAVFGILGVIVGLVIGVVVDERLFAGAPEWTASLRSPAGHSVAGF